VVQETCKSSWDLHFTLRRLQTFSVVSRFWESRFRSPVPNVIKIFSVISEIMFSNDRSCSFMSPLFSYFSLFPIQSPLLPSSYVSSNFLLLFALFLLLLCPYPHKGAFRMWKGLNSFREVNVCLIFPPPSDGSGGTSTSLFRYTHFRYPRFCISAVLFQYHEEHQYPIDCQILKPTTCVEPSPRLSGNVMQMISLASENSGASVT
jgi:hypothetical protein